MDEDTLTFNEARLRHQCVDRGAVRNRHGGESFESHVRRELEDELGLHARNIGQTPRRDDGCNAVSNAQVRHHRSNGHDGTGALHAQPGAVRKVGGTDAYGSDRDVDAIFWKILAQAHVVVEYERLQRARCAERGTQRSVCVDEACRFCGRRVDLFVDKSVHCLIIEDTGGEKFSALSTELLLLYLLSSAERHVQHARYGLDKVVRMLAILRIEVEGYEVR